MPHHALEFSAQLRKLYARRRIALHAQRRLIGTRPDAGDAAIDLFGHRDLLFSRCGNLLVHLLDQRHRRCNAAQGAFGFQRITDGQFHQFATVLNLLHR